jgi:hypothetical protein
MLTLADIAARVQSTMRPMAQSIIYRATALFSPRAAALAPVGATTITLNNLPAGMDRVKVGDTFNSGLQTFTSEVVAVGGVITSAPFTPALTTQIASGATVSVTRNTDTESKGFVELLDTSRTGTSPLVKQTGMSATIFTDSMPFAPKVGDTIIASGRNKKIENVGLDPAGVAWAVLAQG